MSYKQFKNNYENIGFYINIYTKNEIIVHPL